MTPLPTSVKIGPVTYVVTVTSRLLAGNVMGEINYYTSEIELRPNLSEDVTRIVLLHEIIHGILRHAGIHEHDEQQIDVLCHGIDLLLQDNAWLTERAAPDKAALPTES